LLADGPFSVFEFSPDACKAIQERVAADVEAQIADKQLTPMIMPFGPESSMCEPERVRVCGTFFSEADAQTLEPWAQLQAGFWLRELAGDCDAVTAGFNFRVSSTSDECLDVSAGWTCSDDNVTFPPCK
jgi:hypothetical protein